MDPRAHSTLAKPRVVSETLARLGAEQRLLLGLLATERRLTLTSLHKLGRSHDWQLWVNEHLQTELVVDAGVAYGHPYAQGITGERSYALAPAARAAVLWCLAEQGELERTVAAGRSLFGESSLAGFAIAPYSGDLQRLELAGPELLRRSLRSEDHAIIRERLKEAGDTSSHLSRLVNAWGNDAWYLIEQILLDARVALDPVEAVYRWAVEHAALAPRARSLRVVAEHAFCRGDRDALAVVTARLADSEQAPFRAALSVLQDEPTIASRFLDDLAAHHRGSTGPWPPNVVALLALMAFGRGSAAATQLNRRLMQRMNTAETPALRSWPVVDFEKAITRAMRALARRMTQPDSERLRLSPHHFALDTPAWVLLLSALSVQLEETTAVTRNAWAQRLVEDGTRWNNAGFRWMGRQALHLAKAMSPGVQAALIDLPPCRSGELLICCLLDREPEWRRALQTLERLVETAEQSAGIVSRRIAWYVDMASGELAKPGLEEYRSGSGWDRGRRVELHELSALRESLPPEDVAVLAALTRPPTKHHSCPEAIEALVGHPRIYNGARGREPVEIVRGRCRIETEEDGGHLLIRFEPRAPSDGIHVEVENESRIVVYRIEGFASRLSRAFAHEIRIPLGQQQEGLALLARLAEHVEVESPALGALRTVDADSTPCLRISPEAGAFYVEIGVRPFGELGRFFPPGIGRLTVSLRGDEDLLDATRNFPEEIALFRSLLGQCPSLASGIEQETRDTAAMTGAGPAYGATLGEDALYTLLTELESGNVRCHIEWKNCRAISARGKLTAGQLHGSLKRIKGWYLVDGRIKLDAVNAVGLADLLRMPFTKSGRFLRLPNGDFVEVEARVRQVLARLSGVARRQAPHSSSELRIPEAAFDAVRALVDGAESLEVAPTASEWLARVDTTLAAQPLVPEELRATLRPYQLDGFRWLWRYSELRLGVCLADDMGLGKTVQVLALLLTRKQAGPALVVAPTSVCSNWLAELGRFTPSLRAVEYAGTSRKVLLRGLGTVPGTADVVVTSYALLQQDAEDLTKLEWNTVVLDEAQFIKNPQSLRAKAAFRLSASYRLAMTGTPIENHLGDLWSIFHFLNPALLGSLNHFRLSYVKPIERDQDEERQARLKRLVQPFLLRRMKSEVLLDLPPVTTVEHVVRFTSDEHLRYALLRRQIHDKLRTPEGKRQHKLQILAEITRLRRFCCHPRLVFPDAPMESSKLDAFMELVEELLENGHRALVFSQFVDFLHLVRERLDERGQRYLYLDGATPAEVRQTRVSAFQAGNADLFLISLKAGGFGINLTGADYVIHLDPWWNPAVEAQATDRAHRIGQQLPVTVYRLVAKDSIEERIVDLHRDKRAIADALLEEGSPADELDRDALLELIR